jgi:hypothetical protein
MERSAIRVSYVQHDDPGFRFAHPGYCCWTDDEGEEPGGG